MKNSSKSKAIAPLPERCFPPPWSVEELDAMTRPTKSKIESIKPDQQDFNLVEKEYGPLPPNTSQAVLSAGSSF
jgi:hypothetical protein